MSRGVSLRLATVRLILTSLQALGAPFSHSVVEEITRRITGESWRGQSVMARCRREGWIRIAGVHPNGTWRLYEVVPGAPDRREVCPTCGGPMKVKG